MFEAHAPHDVCLRMQVIIGSFMALEIGNLATC